MKNNLKLILTTATVGLALSSCIGGQTSPVSKSGQLISSSEVGSLVIPAVMQGTYNAVLTQSSALNESTIAYNKASIAKEAGFGQLVSDTFIATGAVARGVAGMQQYDITYYTNGANANQDVTQVNRTVSGAVYVPLDASGKVLTAKGVVVFFHPTTPIKNLVPSCYLAGAVITPSYCDSGYESAAANIYASSTGYKAIASMYTSQGYIVVMPDYVG